MFGCKQRRPPFSREKENISDKSKTTKAAAPRRRKVGHQWAQLSKLQCKQRRCLTCAKGRNRHPSKQSQLRPFQSTHQAVTAQIGFLSREKKMAAAIRSKLRAIFSSFSSFLPLRPEATDICKITYAHFNRIFAPPTVCV